MEQQDSSNEADPLAVPDLRIEERVGLEDVEQGDLTRPQLGREIGVTRKGSTCSSWVEITKEMNCKNFVRRDKICVKVSL